MVFWVINLYLSPTLPWFASIPIREAYRIRRLPRSWFNRATTATHLSLAVAAHPRFWVKKEWKPRQRSWAFSWDRDREVSERIFDFKRRNKRKGAGRRAFEVFWGTMLLGVWWNLPLTRVLFLLGVMYAGDEYVSHMIIFQFEGLIIFITYSLYVFLIDKTCRKFN